MAVSEIKLCKDCKHFIWPDTPYEYSFGDPTCRRVVWLVYGAPKRCSDARATDGLCGKEGSMYEFDPQPKPDWMNKKPRWFDDPMEVFWRSCVAFFCLGIAAAIYLAFR